MFVKTCLAVVITTAGNNYPMLCRFMYVLDIATYAILDITLEQRYHLL